MQEDINFNRIALAIEFLYNNHKRQPALNEVANFVGLSPFHFQKMFTEWAGISPKKFASFLSIEYAKGLLRNQELTLFDVAFESGLSGSSRLHDLFINIEGMTPGEYKNGGINLNLDYAFYETQFGKILICSSEKGVCDLSFVENEEEGFKTLVSKFPNAKYDLSNSDIQQAAVKAFKDDSETTTPLKLHLKGTSFQIKVWQALLNIPSGKLSSYGNIAKEIGIGGASRAVGNAIGDNPIAFIIPCHRVIQSTGLAGNYMWGPVRKLAMIGWEAARLSI